ncbi:MAG: BACON domain-containing protein [Bacteroidaceae bacterium]|nr:BACON domain-containing protein [Bacteroidaceae bacterium]
MRKISFVLVLWCTVMFFADCHNKEYNLTVVPSNEYIHTSDVSLLGSVTSGVIKIDANCGWSLSCDSDFVHLSKTSGNNSDSVYFSITANSSSVKERISIVHLSSSGGIKTTINIKQYKNEELIEVDPDHLDYLANQTDTRAFYVKANGHWSIDSSQVIPDWIVLSPTQGNGSLWVNVSVQKNDNDSEREKDIIIVGDKGAMAKIKIKQSGLSTLLLASPSNILAEPSDNLYGFTISGNVKWHVKLSSDWIYDLSIDEGYGKDSVTFRCRDNLDFLERQGKIIVISESTNQKDSVIITQKKAELAYARKPVLVACNEKEAEFTYRIESSSFPVTEFGLCYSESPHPTLYDNKIKSSSDPLDEEDARSMINGLTKGHTYYVSVYAVSKVGISYSDDCVFVALPKPDNDDIDRPVF